MLSNLKLIITIALLSHTYTQFKLIGKNVSICIMGNYLEHCRNLKWINYFSVIYKELCWFRIKHCMNVWHVYKIFVYFINDNINSNLKLNKYFKKILTSDYSYKV